MAAAYSNTLSALEHSIRAEKLSVEHDRKHLRFELDQLRAQKEFLQGEWRHLELEQKELSRNRHEFEHLVADNWSIENVDSKGKELNMKINVGGQLFEVPVSTLTKDRFSVLAMICCKNSPSKADKHGVHYIDRDWWIFRHILCHLRTGSLPDDTGLLRELHEECAVYELQEMRSAIEEKLNSRLEGRRRNESLMSSFFRSKRADTGIGGVIQDSIYLAHDPRYPEQAFSYQERRKSTEPSAPPLKTVLFAPIPVAQPLDLMHPEHFAPPLDDPYGFTTNRPPFSEESGR